jgi:hypothetical protein
MRNYLTSRTEEMTEQDGELVVVLNADSIVQSG